MYKLETMATEEGETGNTQLELNKWIMNSGQVSN